MYAFERYMHILKGYVRNKAHPEGSIVEGYIDNEALTFCSMYFNECETKFNRPEQNYDGLIKDRDMNRKTQNSGVVVKGDHKGEAIDFYGVIRDIVKLKYLGRNRVFLFKCDWWDVGNEKNGMKFDDYNYISVNVTRTWYKDEPSVLACQAEQVFYMKDMKFGNNYQVVQRIIPRATYDILVKRDEEEEKNEEEEKDNDEPYQEFESFGLGNAMHMDDQPTKLCKENMEMICVDIDGELHEEELEVDDNNIEEDETHMDDEVNDDMIDDDSNHEDEIDKDDMIDNDSQ
ncbi:hypothetical protein ACSBR1_018103 [Camellia fascicularis]